MGALLDQMEIKLTSASLAWSWAELSFTVKDNPKDKGELKDEDDSRLLRFFFWMMLPFIVLLHTAVLCHFWQLPS